MISIPGLPTWVHVLRLLVTFLVAAGLGIHAYASFKTHPLVARKWMFFLYSVVFLFTSVGMFAYLMIVLRMGDYNQGPFSFGLFSVLLVLSYLALVYGPGSRNFEWNGNGRSPII